MNTRTALYLLCAGHLLAQSAQCQATGGLTVTATVASSVTVTLGEKPKVETANVSDRSETFFHVPEDHTLRTEQITVVPKRTYAGSVNTQLGSGSGRIILIARAPETLAMSLNADQDVSDLASGTPNSKVAKSVTMSWCLERGRAQVVASALIDRPKTKVQLALAVAADVAPFGSGVSDSPFRFGFSGQRRTLSKQLDAVNVTDSNRATDNTISLYDALPSLYDVPQDGFAGNVRIQLQAVP